MSKCNNMFVYKKTYDHVAVYIYSIGEIVKLVSVVPPPKIIDSVFNQPKIFAHNKKYKISDSDFLVITAFGLIRHFSIVYCQ